MIIPILAGLGALGAAGGTAAAGTAGALGAAGAAGTAAATPTLAAGLKAAQKIKSATKAGAGLLSKGLEETEGYQESLKDQPTPEAVAAPTRNEALNLAKINAIKNLKPDGIV
tara:strand:- start:2052 stop:2390 length:339 start_codon:yes stop_codon:yes gene_type:complete